MYGGTRMVTNDYSAVVQPCCGYSMHVAPKDWRRNYIVHFTRIVIQRRLAIIEELFWEVVWLRCW